MYKDKAAAWLLSIFFISGCVTAPTKTDANEIDKAELQASPGLYFYTIDNDPFVGLHSTTVAPGKHIIKMGAGQRIFGQSCDILAGRTYVITTDKCIDTGPTKATEMANQKKLEEERKVKEAQDLLRYQEYRQALYTKQPNNVLLAMKRDLESKQGGFKTDPDGLLNIVNQQLEPYFIEERKRQEALAAEAKKQEKILAAQNAKIEAELKRERAIAEARRAKEQAEQEARARSYIANFRNSLKVGDETNCGPVIEVKANLIKVYFAVSGYGNEHWIRRNQLFPAGNGCRFINGQYFP